MIGPLRPDHPPYGDAVRSGGRHDDVHDQNIELLTSLQQFQALHRTEYGRDFVSGLLKALGSHIAERRIVI
jgi:hypothetical protein